MTKDIDKKHILIVGQNANNRLKFLNELIAGTNKVVYRFPPDLKTFDDYIEQVRELFPFIPATWEEQNPKKWTSSQVWDFHLDWTGSTHSILILLEEFGQMEASAKFEIIRDYLQTSYYQERQHDSRLNFQLIITQEKDDLIENLIPIFGLNEHETRTAEQVILGKLKTIDLDLT
ncbi:MAG: hypothetical protein O9262_01275 [Cyclobacteriaceae bacterium]|nr:hypothetical protein [Cyclobacteriaceae bacterium]